MVTPETPVVTEEPTTEAPATEIPVTETPVPSEPESTASAQESDASGQSVLPALANGCEPGHVGTQIVPNPVTGVVVSPNPPASATDKLKFSINWSVPNSVQTGDYFTLPLASQIN